MSPQHPTHTRRPKRPRSRSCHAGELTPGRRPPCPGPPSAHLPGRGSPGPTGTSTPADWKPGPTQDAASASFLLSIQRQDVRQEPARVRVKRAGSTWKVPWARGSAVRTPEAVPRLKPGGPRKHHLHLGTKLQRLPERRLQGLHAVGLFEI